MSEANAIIFTKEDGENKMLCPSVINGEEIDQFVHPCCWDLYTKILGHKPTNLYLMYQGIEFRILPISEKFKED